MQLIWTVKYLGLIYGPIQYNRKLNHFLKTTVDKMLYKSPKEHKAKQHKQ